MSGALSCRAIRQALGVYVLGAIDPAERAVVDQHLAVCPDCREELAGLAGLPAMLRKVPISEAERLTMSDLDLAADDDLPTKEMLDSLVARTANVRRIHRWRGLVAAAAAVIVALGGGVVATKALQSGGPPAPPAVSWLQVARTNSATGARLVVKYRSMPWGTDMQIHVAGIKPGTLCEFLVTDSTGHHWPVGGWRVGSWEGPDWYPAATWFSETQLQSFQLAVHGKIVASVHAD